MCEKYNQHRIILLLTVINVSLLLISTYIIIHNIWLMEEMDIIYTSTEGYFIYMINGNMQKQECVGALDCADHLYEIFDSGAEGDIQYTAIYNTTSTYNHYSYTSLLMSGISSAVAIIDSVIVFVIFSRLIEDEE